MVQAELQHSRWAMLATAGILYTAVSRMIGFRPCPSALNISTQIMQIGAEAGLGFPQWYDAGEVSNETSGIPFSKSGFSCCPGEQCVGGARGVHGLYMLHQSK